MFLMRADTLRGQVGEGNKEFFGPCEMAASRANGQVQFGAQQIYKKVKRTDLNYLCTYDLYSPVHNVLDACISITRTS
jgi:hypothetical protein